MSRPTCRLNFDSPGTVLVRFKAFRGGSVRTVCPETGRKCKKIGLSRTNPMTHQAVSAKKKAVSANSTTRPRGGSTSVGGRTGWPYQSNFFCAPIGSASRAYCKANNYLSITLSFVLIDPSFFAVAPHLSRCGLLVHVPRSSNQQCVVGTNYQVNNYLSKTFSFVLIDASVSELAVDSSRCRLLVHAPRTPHS